MSDDLKLSADTLERLLTKAESDLAEARKERDALTAELEAINGDTAIAMDDAMKVARAVAFAEVARWASDACDDGAHTAREIEKLCAMPPGLVALPREVVEEGRRCLVSWFEGGRPVEATERALAELSSALEKP